MISEVRIAGQTGCAFAAVNSCRKEERRGRQVRYPGREEAGRHGSFLHADAKALRAVLSFS